jgi:hypothetical protein
MQLLPKTSVDHFFSGLLCTILVLISKHSFHNNIFEWIFFIIAAGLIARGFVLLLINGE